MEKENGNLCHVQVMVVGKVGGSLCSLCLLTGAK